ncbi:uncharacterized protein LOC108666970 [Hyalella azteca]|uniref:Uncharacterized protein LOC108666970 n=1 Tax=Hyalella azteca TaxID=294128 RepID=A0A8B7N742_HYAAZ|nr:uncharacterized protein LOC108666970 [Hyalella azteca]XP_047735844.1 uncharacterized protein LOC108666970 [Hyalella azteca]XP_047735845.1 uncharacterized protein LOC108666970 [Hyalella azteca]
MTITHVLSKDPNEGELGLSDHSSHDDTVTHYRTQMCNGDHKSTAVQEADPPSGAAWPPQTLLEDDLVASDGVSSKKEPRETTALFSGEAKARQDKDFVASASPLKSCGTLEPDAADAGPLESLTQDIQDYFPVSYSPKGKSSSESVEPVLTSDISSETLPIGELEEDGKRELANGDVTCEGIDRLFVHGTNYDNHSKDVKQFDESDVRKRSTAFNGRRTSMDAVLPRSAAFNGLCNLGQTSSTEQEVMLIREFDNVKKIPTEKQNGFIPSGLDAGLGGGLKSVKLDLKLNKPTRSSPLQQQRRAVAFENQYKAWSSHHRPYVKEVLHDVISLEITVFILGWSLNLITYFVPTFIFSHILVSFLSKLRVPMLHEEGFVLRKLNLMTLFTYITLTTLGGTLAANALNDSGNFFIAENVTMMLPVYNEIDLPLDACEARCASLDSCVMYEYKQRVSNPCRLHTHTHEQLDLSLLHRMGSILGVKKIVQNSNFESDGKLYYLTELVDIGAGCKSCHKHCTGYFHIANLDSQSEVLREIAKRGDALYHPILYENGRSVPFRWRLPQSDSYFENPVDYAPNPSRYQTFIYEEYANMSSKSYAKILCQASPLTSTQVTTAKFSQSYREMLWDSLQTLAFYMPLSWSIGTIVNELKLTLTIVLRSHVGIFRSHVNNFTEDLYHEFPFGLSQTGEFFGSESA